MTPEPHIGSHSRLRSLSVTLIFVLGILCSFIGIRYPGLGYGDEGYQLLCIDYYRESPAAMLSYFIARGWQLFCGDSVIGMRILASLLTTASIGVGCICLYRYCRNGMVTALIFVGCVITSRISDFNLYNWETGSFLFAALSLATMLSILDRNRIWKFVLLGILLALTFMAKITMIAEIIPAVGVAVYSGRGNFSKISLSIMATLTGFVITILAVTQPMTGGIEAYIASFVPENITSGHSAGDWYRYIDRFLSDFPFQIAVWTPTILSLPLAVILPRVRPVIRWMLSGALLLLTAVTLWLFDNLSDYEYPLLGCALPLLVYVVAVGLHKGQKNSPRHHFPDIRFAMWVILVYVLLIGFGSDSWYERCTIIFALPMAVGIILKQAEPWKLQLLKRVLALGFVILSVMWGCRLMMEVRTCVFDGSYLPRCQYLMLNKRINGQLSEVTEALEKFDREGYKYVIIGDRYPALAIFGYDNGLSIHQFGQLLHDGDEEIERLRAVSGGRDAVLLIVKSSEDCTEVETMLQSEGFTSVETGDFTRIFEKRPSLCPQHLVGDHSDGTTARVSSQPLSKGTEIAPPSQYFDDSFKKKLRYVMTVADLVIILLSGIWLSRSLSRLPLSATD